ncbi:MAG: hypothetical protein Q8P67_08920 [archaeon]|nr:hypothetical protein [archaeon]
MPTPPLLRESRADRPFLLTDLSALPVSGSTDDDWWGAAMYRDAVCARRRDIEVVDVDLDIL